MEKRGGRKFELSWNEKSDTLKNFNQFYYICKQTHAQVLHLKA